MEAWPRDVFISTAQLTTDRFGAFDICVTDPLVAGGEHIVLVRHSVEGRHNVPCRVASACVTSTVFGSDDCDCRQQLDASLDLINHSDGGVLLYLDQEGRGHGLATKIRALSLKNQGLNTLEAVEALGLPTDIREYSAVKVILDALGIHSINLITNNIAKLTGIRSSGVDVRTITELKVAIPERAARHVAAKSARFHIRSDVNLD